MKNVSEKYGRDVRERAIQVVRPRCLVNRLLIAQALVSCFMVALALPGVARAQLSLTLSNSVGNPVTETNFGRQVSFTLLILANNGVSEDTQLVATLPPGAIFQSAGAGFSATVSDSGATGEQVTLGLGEIAERSLNNFLTITIANSVPDSTLLHASFQASGHLLGSTQVVSSNTVSSSFQAGFLPVGVYLVSHDAPCSRSAENGDGTSTHFNSSDDTGTGSIGSAFSTIDVSAGGQPASAVGSTDKLSTPLSAPFSPTKVGDISTPNSIVKIDGIGGFASALGGYQLLPEVGLLDAIPLNASVSCGGVSAGISFLNPNPYLVPLILDERVHYFSAASEDEAASAEVGGGDLARSGSGIESHIVFQRFLHLPTGNTERVRDSATCFPDVSQFTSAFATCSNLTDTTNSFPGSGLLVRANDTPATSADFTAEIESDLDAGASAIFGLDPNTGSVVGANTGYAEISGAVSVRIMRGDANVVSLLNGLPARLTFTGNSPINISVTDPAGRRAGFQPPPNPTPPLLNAQPSVFAEISGASYSGIDSHPQVIDIPDPKPGSYQVQVLGTGNGTFLLTTETLDINDQVVDDQSVSGTVTPGSSSSFTFNVDEQGHVTMPGSTGTGTPPTTVASLSPQPNGAGWDNSNVTVTLTATASATSATVKQLSYSATGVQAIASTTVSGSSASIGISNEGVTTLNFFATDSAGNIETAKNLTIRLDKTPPSLNCGVPDSVWHAADVSIPCSASDAGSGLANASDASFSLSTSVPTGTETANAATGTHSVCDVAGNCATAGPISGNMVDKKPPSINVSTPTNGASYLLNQSVNANYACTDGGSGVATCSSTVANGSPIDTATVGSKTFTVNAADNVGNVASPQSVTYSVGYSVCLLYDPTRAVQGGSTIPLKIQLCDANNADVSSSAVVVHAVSLVQVSTSASEVLQASGNANPDNDFRFDSTLGPTGGYIFNLSTKGLTTGSYVLTFTAGADPLSHVVSFQVR